MKIPVNKPGSWISKFIPFWLLASLVLLPANRAWADFTGIVIAVIDGDTVSVRAAGKKFRVRLDQIDAPERDQDWGNNSRQALTKLVLNRRVNVVTSGHDDYGRTLGHLYLTTTGADTGADIDAEMVRTGNAWAYRHYLRDKQLLALEDEARRARRGLWSLPGPVPPWLHRHPNRKFKQLFQHSEADTTCGNKRYCRDMVNCAEAMLYLKCGVTSLDSNGDGVPCEMLCRPPE